MESNQIYAVTAEPHGSGVCLSITIEGRTLNYTIKGHNHSDYQDFFAELANDVGTRMPHVLEGPTADADGSPEWRPLITEYLSPKSRAGYGDPAVLKTEEGYYLVATSNDALDAFPILHSTDLETWTHEGFVFPEGEAPSWAAHGQTSG